MEIVDENEQNRTEQPSFYMEFIKRTIKMFIISMIVRYVLSSMLSYGNYTNINKQNKTIKSNITSNSMYKNGDKYVI